MAITHVCLSDMHFGASTSLLTKLDGVEPDYQAASPVLEALVPCLRSLTAGQERKPTLVLAGDIFEMALSRTNEAAMSFDTFVKLAFGGPDGDVFAREIMYVPGNHDHHLWETARETQYVEYTERTPIDRGLLEPWHTTRLFEPAAPRTWTQSYFIGHLIRRRLPQAGIRVNVAYPNFGLDGGERCVAFTHGHFIEPIYLAMTRLRDAIFGARDRPMRVYELEAENFAWIDFFWSTMGRSGQVGDAVQKIYEMIGSESGREKLVGILSERITERIDPPWGTGWMVRRIVQRGLTKAAEQGMERGHVAAPLSPDAREGLVRYIGEPLRMQLQTELKQEQIAPALTVVFGHTHKPFEEALTVDGYARPVSVLNTGGWVVDSIERNPLHGAALVVVDDDLNVASVRVYNETTDGAGSTVAVAAVDGENALAADLADEIDPAAPPWSTLSETIVAEVELRASALRARSREGT